MTKEKRSEINRRTRGSPRARTRRPGKAINVKNAMRHGIFAKSIYIAEKDRPAFDRLRAELLAHFAPIGPVETLFVDRIVTSFWRLSTLVDVERLHEGIDYARDDDLKYGVSTTKALLALIEAQSSMTRAELLLERSIHQTLAALHTLQAGAHWGRDARISRVK